MTTVSDACGGAEAGRDLDPPSLSVPLSSNAAAAVPETTEVVVTVSALETECSAGNDGDPKAGKVVVEQKQREGQKCEAAVPGPEVGGCVAVDVGCGAGGMDDGGDWGVEKVCRICHLSPDRRVEGGSQLIQIGCGCKDELGTAHRHCAETWFRLKGNRCCEICGVNAKNITGDEDGSFMEEWHGRRLPRRSGYRNSSERGGCWRGQPFCNFLMACLVIAFILPWFFRVNMF